MAHPTPELYNYATFPYEGMADDFGTWIEKLRVTGPAPDFEAIWLDADGIHRHRMARLSDFTREGPVIVEFGSIT